MTNKNDDNDLKKHGKVSFEVSSLTSSNDKEKELKKPRNVSFEVSALMSDSNNTESDDDFFDRFIDKGPKEHLYDESLDDFYKNQDTYKGINEKVNEQVVAERIKENTIKKSTKSYGINLDKKTSPGVDSRMYGYKSPTKYSFNKNVGDNILKKICEDKLKHIEEKKRVVFESKILELIPRLPHTRGFIESIQKKINNGQNALIAECKKASPSKGIIRTNYEPGIIAKSYQSAGAACISVLTDKPYFQGSGNDLRIVKKSCEIPVIRKDFILDPYQVIESRALGADCILLIMCILENSQAHELEDAAIKQEMDVLIEIHDEHDLERALTLKSKMIGINNRDLKTLKVDLATTERLAPKIPKDRIVICESGIKNHDDILRMNKSGVYGFLVGETLMSQEDIEAATRELLNI